MSLQIKLDEMLDFLNWAEHPDYLPLKRQVENLAQTVAEAVTKAFPELTLCGEASFEGTVFAGTCAPFEPTAPGPVPDVLVLFDVEVDEWLDMCDEG